MFIYLSKKIAIPNNTKVNCLAWKRDHGYIAVGGEDGLLKVLKLDPVGSSENTGRTAGLAAPTNLSMNQALEGHSGSIQVAVWNEIHQKLTTSDKFGVIIVWMLYKGSWYEEMINNRNKSTVTGMAWNTEGQKICIVYEDGCIILGSVDGNRIWGKEIKGVVLTGVQWSPDGKLLLFSCRSGELHLYDNQGLFARKLNVYCTQITATRTLKVTGLQWYSGSKRKGQPVLVVCYQNGRMQLMQDENDDDPVIVHMEMETIDCRWNHNGTILAVVGMLTEGEKEVNVVQFYSSYGEHLRTLKVPGKEISACTWENGSLRIALAVDSFIYFANIRPNYSWTYFMKTIVFVNEFPRDKEDTTVTFWDTASQQCYSKNVHSLIAISSCKDLCVMAVKIDPFIPDEEEDSADHMSFANEQYSLLVCNSIATLIDAKSTDLEVTCVAINSNLVVASSMEQFLVWQYKTSKGSLRVTNKRTDHVYHIDDIPSGMANLLQDNDQHFASGIKPPSTSDFICCLAMSEDILIIGRESGLLQRYSVPNITLTHRYKRQVRTHSILINCNSSRAAIIDITGVLTLLVLEPDDVVVNKSLSDNIAMGQEFLNNTNSQANLERKDVWAMCWASDNPNFLAIMEKTRMYVIKGNDPEEPILCSGYICSFEDLEIRTVLLDDVISGAVAPNKDQIMDLEVKSLRDTRDLLSKVGLKEAVQFVNDNPHPRLWRLIAETALQLSEFEQAEAAYVRCTDFAGIQLCKRLSNIQNAKLRDAEIASHFKNYDEAEKLYLDCDRRDLAITLRKTLGDWFRVLQLIRMGVGSSDLELEKTFNSIGDFFLERQIWDSAKEYYEKARNYEQLIKCCNLLEDYDTLENLIEKLPERSPHLSTIAEIFTSVGLCNQSVDAYVKFGDINLAVETCVGLNQWDQAISLAERFKMPDIGSLMDKYSDHLLKNDKSHEAVELYRKANRYLDAARIMYKIAKSEAGKYTNLLKVKKLFILAAMLIEDHLTMNIPDANVAGTRGLAMLDMNNSVDGALMEAVWHGAEGYHFMMLAQRQLHNGYIDNAMKTSYRLRDYEDVLNVEALYGILALASASNRAFATCSKAFIKLESLTKVPESRKQIYEDLAVDIFSINPPRDSRTTRMECINCDTLVPDWCTSCPNCALRFPGCISTGRSIPDTSNVWRCARCQRCSFPQEMTTKRCCPLCHYPLHF